MSAPSPDQRQIRFVEVDGVRLRTSVRGQGPPLLLITGLGASLDLAEAVRAGADRPRGAERSRSTRPGSASRRPTPCRAGCPASPAPSRRCSTPSATTASTCWACRSAGSSPSSWPTRHHGGCGGWCSPRLARGSAACPAPRASCWPWRHRAATTSRTTIGASPGAIYGGQARRDPDALLHGSLARFVERPSMRGLPRPAVRDQRVDQPAVAAEAAAADARAGRRRRPDRPAAQRTHPRPLHSRRAAAHRPAAAATCSCWSGRRRWQRWSPGSWRSDGERGPSASRYRSLGRIRLSV